MDIFGCHSPAEMIPASVLPISQAPLLWQSFWVHVENSSCEGQEHTPFASCVHATFSWLFPSSSLCPGGQGWGLEEMMQKSTFWNMPIATAVAADAWWLTHWARFDRFERCL